jgi:hypothetical protein
MSEHGHVACGCRRGHTLAYAVTAPASSRSNPALPSPSPPSERDTPPQLLFAAQAFFSKHRRYFSEILFFSVSLSAARVSRSRLQGMAWSNVE